MIVRENILVSGMMLITPLHAKNLQEIYRFYIVIMGKKGHLSGLMVDEQLPISMHKQALRKT